MESAMATEALELTFEDKDSSFSSALFSLIFWVWFNDSCISLKATTITVFKGLYTKKNEKNIAISLSARNCEIVWVDYLLFLFVYIQTPNVYASWVCEIVNPRTD
jgi:hypothetical protein